MEIAALRIDEDNHRPPVRLLAVVLLTVLAACASPPEQRFSGNGEPDAGLYRWVEDELGPYLTTQLSRHPRFKGEPVLVVSMNGADVRSDIDALTQSIRTRIMDQLLSQPGINLVWRPAMRPWQHHRAGTQPICSDTNRAHYYIGIEITPTPERKVRVSIRALDLMDQSWVSGFGKTWQGALTAAQRRAWSQNRVDAYLRGLRVLPFTEAETDLLAAYLAENLACLLNKQGIDRPLVYLDTGETTQDVMTKVTNGVHHYLIRHQAIRLASEQSQADLVLSANLNSVDQRLHQFWLTAKPTSITQHQLGVDTDGYILLRDSPRIVGEQSRSHRGRTQQASHAAFNGVVFSKLRLTQRHDPSHCIAVNPRSRTESLVPSDGAIRSELCSGLEFDLYQAARVYVLNHRSDGELVRLMPNSCVPGRTSQSVLPAGTKVWVPYRLGTTNRPKESIRSRGLESFYAIAVKQSAPTNELDTHLQRLPEACSDQPLADPASSDLDHWLSRLDNLVDRLGERVDWRGLRVRHE